MGKKCNHFYIVCGASYFGYCIKNLLMPSTIESSLHRLKWFICVYVRVCSVSSCSQGMLVFFYEFLVMALLKHKRQTINNKINTWTVPWWSAVVKFWTKKIRQSIKNLFCVAVVSLPLIYDSSHSRNNTTRMQWNSNDSHQIHQLSCCRVHLTRNVISVQNTSCYALSHGVRSVVFFFARQK